MSRSGGAIALAQIPLTLASHALASVLNDRGQYAVFQVARSALIVGAAIGILVLGASGHLDIGSAVAVYVAVNVMTTLLIAWLVSQEQTLGLGAERALARGLAAYGLKSHVGVLSSALNQRLTKLVISLALAPRQLGLCVVAVAVAGSISTIGSLIAQITLPQIAADIPREELGWRVSRLVAVTLLASVGVPVAFALLARRVVVIAFGDAFEAAAGPARILVVAGAFIGVNAVLANVLKGLGRPLHAGIGELVALGVTAVHSRFCCPCSASRGLRSHRLRRISPARPGWLAAVLASWDCRSRRLRMGAAPAMSGKASPGLKARPPAAS